MSLKSLTIDYSSYRNHSLCLEDKLVFVNLCLWRWKNEDHVESSALCYSKVSVQFTVHLHDWRELTIHTFIPSSRSAISHTLTHRSRFYIRHPHFLLVLLRNCLFVDNLDPVSSLESRMYSVLSLLWWRQSMTSHKWPGSRKPGTNSLFQGW